MSTRRAAQRACKAILRFGVALELTAALMEGLPKPAVVCVLISSMLCFNYWIDLVWEWSLSFIILSCCSWLWVIPLSVKAPKSEEPFAAVIFLNYEHEKVGAYVLEALDGL